MANLKILRPGPLTTVQDLGRLGHLGDGVSVGGALDPQAARIANLLARNAESTALLEITLGNAAFEFEDDRVLAWCGAKCQAEIGGEQVPPGHAIEVRGGEQLTIGPAKLGCRFWLAISGGIEVTTILGSRSTDLRGGFGGFGGRSLRAGDELPLGKSNHRSPSAIRVSSWSAPTEWSQTATINPCLRVVRGAEWDEFTADSQAAFLRGSFHVSHQSDRMGSRLEGAILSRHLPNERLSEPVAPGTIQVANDGGPIILLGDCQTIGGYPKIAHVITVDLPLAAQLRPGDSVYFREVSAAQAMFFFRMRELDFKRFRVGLQLQAR